MKNIFRSIDQWSNRKEKLSRKQRKLRVFIYIFTCAFYISVALLIYSIIINKLWLSITSGVLSCVCLIPIAICIQLEEKEFQRVTNKSIEYYKRRYPFFIQEFIAIILSSVIGAALVGISNSKMNTEILCSICIGTFSLSPIIYVFILPQIKETINSTRKELSGILVQLSLSKKNSNISILKKKQGEIYNLISSSNHVTTQLIISVALFVMAIVTLFFPNEDLISQVCPAASIVYSLYELLMLIKLSQDFHSYNTKKFETKMKNQILDIETKEKSKQKKELLKVYTKRGKAYGENSREHCLKSNFKDLYKTAYIIIKNKQNKYFVFQQILDYKKAQYLWQATFYCDELSKENIKTTFIEKAKNDFGLLLNKANFKIINKDIDLDNHQIIEVYLAETDLKNVNIDYNIDLYVTAKFVTFNRFAKILTSNKDLPKNIAEDIRLKLSE